MWRPPSRPTRRNRRGRGGRRRIAKSDRVAHPRARRPTEGRRFFLRADGERPPVLCSPGRDRSPRSPERGVFSCRADGDARGWAEPSVQSSTFPKGAIRMRRLLWSRGDPFDRPHRCLRQQRFAAPCFRRWCRCHGRRRERWRGRRRNGACRQRRGRRTVAGGRGWTVAGGRGRTVAWGARAAILSRSWRSACGRRGRTVAGRRWWSPFSRRRRSACGRRRWTVAGRRRWSPFSRSRRSACGRRRWSVVGRSNRGLSRPVVVLLVSHDRRLFVLCGRALYRP